MTNNNTSNSLPDFYFPTTMASSSSSSPPQLLPPTTPYHNPQKVRKKRSKLIKIDPCLLLPSPNPSPSSHSLTLSTTTTKHFARKSDSNFTPPQFRHCCPECFKQFGSEKALYGHMRCHPDRDYRGMTRKPRYHRISNSSLMIHQEVSESAAASAVVMSSEDHEVASCLLMLSRTGILETEADYGGDGGDGDGDGGGGASCSFECSSCKKVFGSHQALGGHRASHKNVKGCFAINRSFDEVFDHHDHHHHHQDQIDENTENVDGDTEIKDMAMVLGHKCSICLRVFPSGQALGGHKRCHWEKGEDLAAAVSSSMNNHSNLQGLNGNYVSSSGLDLNLPAPTSVDDDDQSCSSYSSANFTLDLRLGL